MGFSVIGLPHYTIWHLYEPSVDDLRHMEEMELERKAQEEEERARELAQQKENARGQMRNSNRVPNGESAMGSDAGPAAQPVEDADKGSSDI